MPKPGKGTKSAGFILLKASKDMQEALLPMIMLAFPARIADIGFSRFEAIITQREWKRAKIGIQVGLQNSFNWAAE